MSFALRYLFAIIFALLVNCAALAYQVTDCRGNVFEFASVPTCATVVPAVTQSIYAIGAQDLLLANSLYCVQPEDSKTKTKVGTYLNPDYEKILELKPQVFILPSLSDDRIENRLKSLGVKCFVLHAEGLENICKDIEMLGNLFARQSRAAEVVSPIKAAMKQDASTGKKAFFMFGNLAAGKGSYIGEIMERCGIENCADKIGKPWAVPTREYILTSRPDIIFVELPTPADKRKIQAFFKSDPAWSATPAVLNNAIYYVNREVVVIPSVRVVEIFEIVRSAVKNIK